MKLLFRGIAFLGLALPASANCTGKVYFGDEFYRVEIVADAQSRAKGLMFREHLDADAGMLFVFPTDDRRSFWMRNTVLPLDILFYSSDGQLSAAQENAVPFDETGLPGYGSLVLEVNAGEYGADADKFKQMTGYMLDDQSQCVALAQNHPLRQM